MNKSVQHRISELQQAVDEWLSPDNQVLKKAIDRTVEENLFGFEDIKYQIRTLKKTLKRSEFERWTDQAGLDEVVIPKNILCFHAGNLPLVGVQDILSVALSGHYYMGKLSRKDPWLPDSLLRILQKKNLINGRWSTSLQELTVENTQADGLLFSGSSNSVQPVLDSLINNGMASDKTPVLLRTAYFSIAFIEDDHPDTFEHLSNAVLRYAGKGCRSVGLVVAPFSLASKKCDFTDYAEIFLMNNPQHQKAPPSLYHRYAYNKAVGIDQAWLDHFLIEETTAEPDEPFILHWVKGDRNMLRNLTKKYRDRLQTVYVKDPSVDIDGLPVQTELLIDAQRPPIWWKPDGTDPLEWLTKI